MNPRSLVGVSALLLAALACRDETTAPTEAPTPVPETSVVAASALAFYQLSSGGSRTAYGDHACGVTTDNRAYCWGNNYFGQLGSGTKTGPELCETPYGPVACSTRPVLVNGAHSFRQVSAGGYHTCGVTTDYHAYCWGSNFTGQLGDGTTTTRLTPVPVVGDLRFRQVDAGFLFTCGVTYSDNRAYCWGANTSAQLGDRSTTTRLRPVAVTGARSFRQVSAGGWHACAVTTSDVAYCWGRNNEGQVGDSTTVKTRYQPVRVEGTRLFRQIDAGLQHTCGVTTDFRAFCWGDGRQGQIGNGNRYISYWPRAVAGGLSFRRVTAGFDHTCAETTTSRAYCWGWNSYGALGDGTTTLRPKPVAVTGGLWFAQVSAGNEYTCGKTPTNVAYCWGWNRDGFVGDGTTTNRLTPTKVAGTM
jgi:alpha-tubulin suppressor-like RCC1 family protein